MARFVPLLLCLILIEVTIVGEAPTIQPTPSTARSTTASTTGVATGPLRVSSENSRYFATPDGKPILLTGSHTWQNFQDTGYGDPPPVFDYPAYLDFLQRHNHNFFRLWVWEQTRWSNEIVRDDYFNLPNPYLRTGSQLALDGKPRFDLDRFDQSYFDRMRERIVAAGSRGMYVAVMLFDGWSIEACKGELCDNNPWQGHPFNRTNNINGVDGDLSGNASGEETQTLASPQITARQEAYVRKVIDTVGDLDNVLYEISNEGPANSAPWQYHMIEFIKAYEAARGKVHPVGMTSTYPGDNQDLWNSPADWISPNGDVNNPPLTTGDKVVLSDTDHLCGLCGDSSWPWKSFTRGENPIYMDAYDGAYGIGGHMDDPTAESIRANLGYVRQYASQLDLATAKPQPDLCSTGYCLANSEQYVVFTPGEGFTISLNGAVSGSRFDGQWLDPDTGRVISVSNIRADSGGEFHAPFSGPAVLYLKKQPS